MTFDYRTVFAVSTPVTGTKSVKSVTKLAKSRGEATNTKIGPTFLDQVTSSNCATHLLRLPRTHNPWPALFAELEKLRDLKTDWDGANAAPPNYQALFAARTVLDACLRLGVEPSRVLASVEDGVCITFRKGKRYSDVECFNSGAVVALLSDGQGEIKTSHVESGQDAAIVEEIRTFLGR